MSGFRLTAKRASVASLTRSDLDAAEEEAEDLASALSSAPNRQRRAFKRCKIEAVRTENDKFGRHRHFLIVGIGRQTVEAVVANFGLWNR